MKKSYQKVLSTEPPRDVYALLETFVLVEVIP